METEEHGSRAQALTLALSLAHWVVLGKVTSLSKPLLLSHRQDRPLSHQVAVRLGGVAQDPHRKVRPRVALGVGSGSLSLSVFIRK